MEMVIQLQEKIVEAYKQMIDDMEHLKGAMIAGL